MTKKSDLLIYRKFAPADSKVLRISLTRLMVTSHPLKTCNTCGRTFATPDDFLRSTSRWRVCELGNLWFNCTCHSTSMIIKGKFDWYDPMSKLSAGAKSIFNEISAIKDMPRIPSFVMEIQTLIQDDNTTAAQLSAIAKQDPLLASQILKIANIQVSGRGVRIESLAHAITFIGIKALKDIVLVAAMQNFKFQSKRFNSQHFWDHSFVVGRVAEAITQHFKLDLLADEVYIAGCLCNIGKSVLAICQPETADKYAVELEDLNFLGNWQQAEVRNKGFQHTVLGEIGAVFWGLPEHVTDAISDHHKMPTTNGKVPISLAEVIAFANQMAHWILLQPHHMDHELYLALCNRFKISEVEAEKLVEKYMQLANIA